MVMRLRAGNAVLKAGRRGDRAETVWNHKTPVSWGPLPSRLSGRLPLGVPMWFLASLSLRLLLRLGLLVLGEELLLLLRIIAAAADWGVPVSVGLLLSETPVFFLLVLQQQPLLLLLELRGCKQRLQGERLDVSKALTALLRHLRIRKAAAPTAAAATTIKKPKGSFFCYSRHQDV